MSPPRGGEADSPNLLINYSSPTDLGSVDIETAQVIASVPTGSISLVASGEFRRGHRYVLLLDSALTAATLQSLLSVADAPEEPRAV